MWISHPWKNWPNLKTGYFKLRGCLKAEHALRAAPCYDDKYVFLLSRFDKHDEVKGGFGKKIFQTIIFSFISFGNRSAM